jgi:hypothetical protein
LSVNRESDSTDRSSDACVGPGGRRRPTEGVEETADENATGGLCQANNSSKGTVNDTPFANTSDEECENAEPGDNGTLLGNGTDPAPFVENTSNGTFADDSSSNETDENSSGENETGPADNAT